MANCHTDGDVCSGTLRFGGLNTSNHCDAKTPNDAKRAKVLIYSVYPPLDYDNANVGEKPRNAVMYPSVVATSRATGPQAGYASAAGFGIDSTATCGKHTKEFGCSATGTFEYRPNELSFAVMEGDTWFAYVWDMGENGGTVGTPCYNIQRETRSGSTTFSSGGNTPPTTTPYGSNTFTSRCIPCTNFYCTPAESYCNYTYDGPDETGDPDCPFPLIFGIGTNSNKVVFKYESLSDELPNGVTNLSFVHNGTEYPAWNPETYTGDPIVTNQMPWIAGEDELFSRISIYEGAIFESGNKQDLKIKVKISPNIDTTVDPVVITGTKWELMELMSPGLNYAVNDTFTLSYTHIRNNQTTATISIGLKITGVGPYEAPGGAGGFDILRAGDTINGHVITRTFHTNINNFLYHVLYLDGDGNDFQKDTQYTSDRDHVITVLAGYGITDRAALIGMYEFLNKSIQFSTYSVDPTSPDIYNSIKQPSITANIANGQLSSVTIDDPGQGWNKIKHEIRLVITPPETATGRSAVVEGVFTAGQLTDVKILDRGSGYSSSSPPSLYIRNVYARDNITFTSGISEKDAGVDPFYDNVRKSGTFPQLINRLDSDPVAKASEDLRRDSYKPFSMDVERNNGELLVDPKKKRLMPLPQRLYSKGVVDKLRDTYDDYGFKIDPDAPVDATFKEQMKKSFDSLNNQVQNHFDSLTQERIPEFKRYPDTLIETTQRRFVDLPKASPYTKYLINQYRAASQSEASMTITIGCNVAESGCDHIICPPPALPASSTSTGTGTNPQTGQPINVNYTLSYSMLLGPLGPGCANWSATGRMTLLNNLTKSAFMYANAVAAYGNPFDI